MTESATASTGDITLPRVGKRGAPQAFARKLYEILSTESTTVIAWNDAGTAFHVRDVDTFSEETLTKYYRHSKFSSFQRQLNLYSFRKIVKGPDAGGYAHPMFHRDRPDDLYHVRRSISGSVKYEPTVARVHTTISTGAATSVAVRKGGGRASSKAVAGDWAQPRVHKSRVAARRVGKLSLAPTPKRRDSIKEADAKMVSYLPSTTEETPIGEPSEWMTSESSESSDREENDSCSESESDSDSDGEGDGAAAKGETANATAVSETDPTIGRRVSERKGWGRKSISLFSYAAATDKAAKKNALEGGVVPLPSGDVDGAAGGSLVQSQDSRESNVVQPSATSPSRTSPFNFFRKRFPFMEKSHNRGLSASSVDMTTGDMTEPQPASSEAEAVAANSSVLGAGPVPSVPSGTEEASTAGDKDTTVLRVDADAKATDSAASSPTTTMPPPPKREPREELGLVEQLTNMVEVFDICDLLRRVSTSSRQDKPGGFSAGKPSQHLRQMSVDTDSGVPTSPQSGDRSGLPSLASMELMRDSSRDWDTLMAGSADVSDLGNTMVQSVAEFFSF